MITCTSGPEGHFSATSVAGNRFSSGSKFIQFRLSLTDPARFGKTKVGLIAPLRHPPAPLRLELLVRRRSTHITGAAPVDSHAVSPQQAVRIPGEPRQRHVENPLFGPAGVGGEGEDSGD